MLTRITFGVFSLFFVLTSPAFGDNVNILEIAAKSGNIYKDGGVIGIGSEVFFDEEITVLEIPDEIKGAQFIKGWNEDAGWLFKNPLDPVEEVIDDHNNFLKITVDRPVKLWILFDRSNENAIIESIKLFGVYLWLWDVKKFERTNIITPAKGPRIDFTVYRAKSIQPKGTITLGTLGAAGKIMYVPLVADAAAQAVQPYGKLAAVWGGLK